MKQILKRVLLGAMIISVLLSTSDKTTADNGQISDLENQISENEKKYQEIQDISVKQKK